MRPQDPATPPTQQEAQLQAEIPIHVGTYDIDVAGIVSNIVYHRWLEDLRLAVLSRYQPFDAFVAQGLMPTLVRTEIDYRRSIRMGDQPHARGWATLRSNKTLVFHAEIWVGQHLAARADQVAVLVGIASGRAESLPATLVAALQPQAT